MLFMGLSRLVSQGLCPIIRSPLGYVGVVVIGLRVGVGVNVAMLACIMGRGGTVPRLTLTCGGYYGTLALPCPPCRGVRPITTLRASASRGVRRVIGPPRWHP